MERMERMDFILKYNSCSPGIYRDLLETGVQYLDGIELPILIVNAQHIKYVQGYKTDKKDSAWIAKSLLAEILKGSFVPQVEI